MATFKVSHGTNSKFDKFDMTYLGRNTDDNASSNGYRETAHIGIWFNEGGDLDVAYDTIMPCEIELENPMEAGNLSCLADWVEMQDMSGEEIREMLIEQGYDGIVLEDEEFGGTSYIVFNTNQITIS